MILVIRHYDVKNEVFNVEEVIQKKADDKDL